jgi:hypothetical protein
MFKGQLVGIGLEIIEKSGDTKYIRGDSAAIINQLIYDKVLQKAPVEIGVAPVGFAPVHSYSEIIRINPDIVGHPSNKAAEKAVRNVLRITNELAV